MSDMISSPASDKEPPLPELRFLKALVTILAGTMIVGLITLITLLVIRFPKAGAIAPTLPANLILPMGQRAEAVTMGKGWIAVVTDAQTILIFDAASGTLRQTLVIKGEN
ncbi:MAG: DUF6476 family protein [Rhodobacteraceae bacterium]|nr:DUF6476 family protein [Paracoccaceae bacterium]